MKNCIRDSESLRIHSRYRDSLKIQQDLLKITEIQRFARDSAKDSEIQQKIQRFRKRFRDSLKIQGFRTDLIIGRSRSRKI